MVSGIILATVVIGCVGLFVGLFLGVAGIKFKVEVNPKEEEVLGVLPGNTCGGCGFAGCSGLAHAIAEGQAPVNACPVGGEAVGAKVASIMGVEAQETEKMVAFVKCQGDCEKTKLDYEYTGNHDCGMLAFVPNGGPKSCNYGCLGYGNCVKACVFDAIHVENGVAVVDRERCKACGKCVATCPKSLIELIPYDTEYVVRCVSKNKGKAVIDACGAGCIGCHLCEKTCEHGAITVIDNIARIDYAKCVHCGACAEKCPKHVIKHILEA